MQFPPEIAFRGFEPAEWLKEAIHKEIDKLDDHFGRVVGCRVMVELPHRRHEEGNPYHVRIELSVPGRNLVVNRSTKSRERERETQMTAVDDAFSAMTRRLEDYVRELRGDVKQKRDVAQGRIWRLFPGSAPGERYGFIRTSDGTDVYFHENSLLDTDYEEIDVGTEVRFNEEQGREGPQASTVRVLQKPEVQETSGSETLSVENATVLLEELQDTLANLAHGNGDEEVRERTETLLRSLDDFPGPTALLRDPVEELRAWTQVMLEDSGNGSHPGPGGPADVVERQIHRVREVLEREQSLGV